MIGCGRSDMNAVDAPRQRSFGVATDRFLSTDFLLTAKLKWIDLCSVDANHHIPDAVPLPRC